MSRDFILEMKPLIMITSSNCWDEIGQNALSRNHLVNVIKIFGRKALS